MKIFQRISELWSVAKTRIAEDVLQLDSNIPDKVHRVSNSDTPDTRNVDLPRSLDLEDIPAIYAVGDIHGRYDLLHRMIQAIKEDCIENKPPIHKPLVVFLGDYIDRGFQSNKVIETLKELKNESEFEAVFLKGNHEHVLLSFLNNPSVGAEWSNFGGRETLISYGVTPPLNINDDNEWKRAQNELREKIPSDHVEFLESLVTFYQIGPFGFVHAGVRSGVPFDEQTDKDRLWIRGEFLKAQKREDLFIIPVSYTHLTLPTKA